MMEGEGERAQMEEEEGSLRDAIAAILMGLSDAGEAFEDENGIWKTVELE